MCYTVLQLHEKLIHLIIILVLFFRGVSDRDAEVQVLKLAQAEFSYGTHCYTLQVAHSILSL